MSFNFKIASWVEKKILWEEILDLFFVLHYYMNTSQDEICILNIFSIRYTKMFEMLTDISATFQFSASEIFQVKNAFKRSVSSSLTHWRAKVFPSHEYSAWKYCVVRKCAEICKNGWSEIDTSTIEVFPFLSFGAVPRYQMCFWYFIRQVVGEGIFEGAWIFETEAKDG